MVSWLSVDPSKVNFFFLLFLFLWFLTYRSRFLEPFSLILFSWLNLGHIWEVWWNLRFFRRSEPERKVSHILKWHLRTLDLTMLMVCMKVGYEKYVIETWVWNELDVSRGTLNVRMHVYRWMNYYAIMWSKLRTFLYFDINVKNEIENRIGKVCIIIDIDILSIWYKLVQMRKI